jgi:tRNA A64-2'-O-ribosylphosphate transferase
MALPDGCEKLHQLQRRLRRDAHTISNHLLSIAEDAKVVQEVSDLLPHIPVYGNLRNGRWYVEKSNGSCYFKSTDGHDGQWHFSHARLNVQVAMRALTGSGVIIVDSTRR